ncbi:phosphopentomutase [Lactobacillus mulieris]|jgi:phosphopentomutase|uniref:phosphopentomutase n=1 Tax=Lactobacillus mulieris TaxID=2508708 RepID=UPI001246F49D|nr:phosphopentomutase [Lactobacillus mulieris]KAA9243632.1 phosphopentomutase [Lactobacillus jensenii]MCW8124278.1 phosphopentomutase [Lactobacillus mulieris]MCZ9599362.1 phosphopentomutase [Lactobacillus mulieris]MDK7327493.1 phosphopentomutase [Lactobacillus mulieris]
MSKFGIIVLDGVGVGAMKDVAQVRPNDVGANTALNIVKAEPNIDIPNLERLGLMNAIGVERGHHLFSPDANWGTANLIHHGADSYLGHQEIMGSKPPLPLLQPFNEVIDQVEAQLKKDKFKVERYGELGLQILVVNDSATVADNLEADPGQVYNITATLDKMPFSEITRLGESVRKVVKVSRVIAFGGRDVKIQDILNARHIKNGKYVGISAPESGVYKKDYHVVHLGYGINPNVQLSSILIKHDIDVALIGKASDIIRCNTQRRFPGVDTNYLFDRFIEQANDIKDGLIFMNIQETDLAGHSQDTETYTKVLETVDRCLLKAEKEFTGEDILIIMADHGDDPTIGHSQHTREKVPLLIYKENVFHKYVGERLTLSDVGATGADFFGVEKLENGNSFLNRINGGSKIS